MSLKAKFSNYFTIIIYLLIACVISLFFVGYLLFESIGLQEKELFSILEDSDLRYLRETIGKARYYIKNNYLYAGDICLGDGTKEKANQDLFKNYTKITEANCFVYMRCSDNGLGWQEDPNDIKGGYNEGHYICVCDSMGQNSEKSYVGKKFSKERAEIIEKEGSFSFPYDYLDNGKIIKRVMRAKAVIDLKTNKVIAIVAVTRTFNGKHLALEKLGIHIAFGVLIIVIIIAASLAVLVSLHTNNLRKTIKYISKIDKGLFPNEPLKLSGKGTLKGIEEAVNHMVDSLKYNKRVSEELELAKGIQTNMIPKDFDKFNNHREFSIYGEMHTAKEVGGDFYDFFMVDDDHFVVSVADVSGKGVPAALFMVIAKTLLKDAAYRFKTPAEIFEHVNETLCESNESGLFVTCWLAIFEISTGKLTFANAGHTSPVIYKDGEISFLESKPNLMLAAMEGIPYKNHEISIKPGDRLFLYTDGITEATNSSNQLYGEERLLSIMKTEKAKNLTSKELLAFVRSDIDKFVAQAPQFDDITMLEMVYKSKNNESTTGDTKMNEMRITAEDKNMDTVTDFIHSCLPEDCTPVIINKIDLAVEEIFVNIAHYAYNPTVGEAWISASFVDNTLTIIFKDNGKEFNPIAKADPDITLRAEERDIGGLGIFLTKKFMDSVNYEYKNRQNILTIRKKID